MITLEERICYFEDLFDELIYTSSTNEKKAICNNIPREYQEDFAFIIECLNGLHKFGYRYESIISTEPIFFHFYTVKEILEYLLEPARKHNLSVENIDEHIRNTSKYCDFITPIINRTLKLGIGRSLLEKTDTSPMLAKKYDPDKYKLNDKNRIFITQKLDGNRCIARWNGDKWEFLSRNGKLMHVDFDMSKYPKEYIYDGEVLSIEQTEQSVKLYNRDDIGYKPNTFNTTSGLINRHTTDKNLIYNIFDIIEPTSMYCERREILDNLAEDEAKISSSVRILPTLMEAEELDVNQLLYDLDWFTDRGAEGLMINFGSAKYENKRTDKLLKFKKLKTIDMKVVEVWEGAGKYKGMCGAIECIAETEDGKSIDVWVGSGLSDEQRLKWRNKYEIVGKIVEVGYFEISQNVAQKGTNWYSLRFPRLMKVRYDKDGTSDF